MYAYLHISVNFLCSYSQKKTMHRRFWDRYSVFILKTCILMTLNKFVYLQVSSSGSVHGLSTGLSRIRLVATDFANVEMASAESEVEVCYDLKKI